MSLVCKASDGDMICMRVMQKGGKNYFASDTILAKGEIKLNYSFKVFTYLHA